MMKHGLTVDVDDAVEFTELFRLRPTAEDVSIVKQMLFKKLSHSGRLSEKDRHFKVKIREASKEEIALENAKRSDPSFPTFDEF